VSLVLALLVGWRLWSIGDSRPLPPVPPGAQVAVRRAVDGDTLLLKDGRRVRLLGVDTPETKREGTPA
jgi:endonuclease YncB( thermonuclease family)